MLFFCPLECDYPPVNTLSWVRIYMCYICYIHLYFVCKMYKLICKLPFQSEFLIGFKMQIGFERLPSYFLQFHFSFRLSVFKYFFYDFGSELALADYSPEEITAFFCFGALAYFLRYDESYSAFGNSNWIENTRNSFSLECLQHTEKLYFIYRKRLF